MQDALKRRPTAALALADGTIFHGQGFGATGSKVGELVFNTAMTGYQEILSDPSYAGQIITFTFPHIGNTGANSLDIESNRPVACGMVTRTLPTPAFELAAEQRSASLARTSPDHQPLAASIPDG